MEQKKYDEMRQIWEQMKATVEEVKALGEKAPQDLKNTVDALNARIDELETKGNRPGFAAESKGDDFAPEAKAFAQFMRKGADRLAPEQVKLLSADSDADGGYLMPVNQASNVLLKLIEFSPIRELANIVTISSGDTYEIPAEGSTDFTAGWVGERGSRAETTSGKLAYHKIIAHEMYANPFVTQKLLDDNAFNVDQWINDRVARRFGVTEGTAFVSGTGSNQPEGLLTATVTEVDSGSAAAVTAAGIIDLYHSLPEYYTRNSTFLAKRATIGSIRKLTDPGTGAFLWQPGLTAGDPGSLLGRPYRECIDMPAEAANTYPVLFGDIRAAYTIVDRQGIRVVRDPYSNKPSVEFYTTKRVGGAVVLAEALRKLKCST